MRMGRLGRIISLLMLLGLVGCLPIPNRYRVAAEISGVLTRDEVPVAGMTICSEPKFYATKSCSKSDANGNFQIAAIYKTEFPTSFLGDRIISYRLILDSGAVPVGIWSSGGMGQAVAAVKLFCDLKKSVPTNSNGGHPKDLTCCKVQQQDFQS